VVKLVRHARRRILGNEVLAQGANASSAALVAFIMLLLVGTQVMSWQWALAIPLAAAAFGLYRVNQRMPSPYAVAQIVDHRLALADTLSTAMFFSQVKPDAPVSSEVRRIQFERAGQLAQSVDVRQAVPYTMPRGVYLMGALVLVASSLFALRYGLSKRLDLKQPLASMLPYSLGGGKPAEHARNARRNPKQVPEAPDENGANAPEPDEQGAGEQDSNQDVQAPGEPDAESKSAAVSKSASNKKQGEQTADDQMAGDDQEEQGENSSGKNGDDNQAGQPGDGKSNQDKNQQPGNQRDANNPFENSSLMSKMKDAFQNLLSKVKPQPPQPGSQQQGAPDQKSQGKPQQGSKQSNGKDGQQQGGQQGEAQEGQNGEDAKNSDAQQSKATGKSESQQASKQPGSGIGSQDGDKAVRQAEQLAAMGKISEILGKRSANVTGEATVEVQSTSQQLHTPYAQSGSEHTQGGAEISRDEVPVALQPYVQQYFEQLRKQAAPPPPPAKK
jgi:hypothetical protein